MDMKVDPENIAKAIEDTGGKASAAKFAGTDKMVREGNLEKEIDYRSKWLSLVRTLMSFICYKDPKEKTYDITGQLNFNRLRALSNTVRLASHSSSCSPPLSDVFLPFFLFSFTPYSDRNLLW